MWVIKLGGSLAFSAELADWLKCIVGLARQTNIVVVPGGGPYANQIRRLQAHWHIDDASAHRLAVLAMDQYAQLLHVLEPSFLPASRTTEIRQAASTGKPVMWFPSRACLTAPDIPQSWDVSSDSLSLWLARQLEAAHLCLVKSNKPEPTERDASVLADSGFIDRYFPVLLGDAACVVSWFSKEEHAAFARTIKLMRESASSTGAILKSRIIEKHGSRDPE